MPAYSVVTDFRDGDQDEGCVVFAKTDIEARRRATLELDLDCIAGLKCKRAPWADEYEAKGIIPAAVMLANGWFLTCTGCEQVISDTVSRWDENDEEIEIETDPVGTQHAAYCTPDCRDRYLATKARRKRGDRRCWQVFKRELLRKLPGALVRPDSDPKHHRYFGIHSASNRERALCFIVAFDFPGSRHGATYRYDLDYKAKRGERQFLVANGDKDAWDAWRDACRETA